MQSLKVFVLFLFLAPNLVTASSLSLDQAVQRGLATSRQLKISQEEEEISSAKTQQAFSGFLPKIALESSAGTIHDRTPNPGEKEVPLAARDRNFYNAKVVLRQSIFSGFKTTAEFASARAQNKIKKDILRTVELETRVKILDIYFLIQLRSRSLELEKELAKTYESRLKDISRRTAAGKTTELDRLQAQYAFQGQSSRIRQLEAEIEQKTLELARLINSPIEEPLTLTDQLEAAAQAVDKVKLPPMAEVLSTAYQQNSEILELDGQRDYLESELRKTSADSFPDLQLVAHGGTASYRRDEIASQRSLSYGFEFQLSLPLFTGFSSVGTRRESVGRLAILEQQRSLAREKLLEDVRALYRSWDVNIETIKSLHLSVKLSEETVRKAESFYELGRTPFTDVLDSYSKKLEARRSLLQAFYERIMLVAKFRALVGTS